MKTPPPSCLSLQPFRRTGIDRPKTASLCWLTRLAAIGLTCTAIAGPTFEEVPDAGSTPSTAQPTTGSGPSGRIKGELTANADASDFEDMFLICITNPEQFSATVDPVATQFNSKLWLFRIDGTGLLANDNDAGSFPTVFSKLTPVATDGSGAALITPGLYFLAISNKDSTPTSAGGAIFNDPTANGTEVSGPDGPGGGQPIQGWTHDGTAPGGTYAIDITGVKFFSPPCEIACPAGAVIDADAFDCLPFDADPNGGCSEPGAPTQNLGSIAPGSYRAACGTTGVEYSGGRPANKDRDWYRFTVASPGYLVLSLVTETPAGPPATNARVTVLRGSTCANQVQIATKSANACPLTIGPIPVEAGPHAVIVTLDGTLPAGPACPTAYVLYVDERPTAFDACGFPTSLPCDIPHLLPGCDDPFCCDLICTFDPTCCDDAWDAVCANGAIAFCPGFGCSEDLDDDGQVSGPDLAILLGQWGGRGSLTADFNNDGTVDAADLAILLGAWGPCT